MQTRLRADKKTLIGLGLALAAAASYGGSAVLARHIVQEYTTPLAASAVGLLFGTVYLFALSVGSLNSVSRLSRRAYLYLALAGATSGVGATFHLFALDRAPVVVVAPVSSIYPLVTLVLTFIFLKQVERISPRVVLGTVMAIAGVILVILGQAG